MSIYIIKRKTKKKDWYANGARGWSAKQSDAFRFTDQSTQFTAQNWAATHAATFEDQKSNGKIWTGPARVVRLRKKKK